MRSKHALATVLGIAVIALSGVAHAQGDVSISIARHAELTVDGQVIIRVHIACDPLPGIEEFQQAFAGGVQRKTGAAAETGIDGTVVCDGLARTHTARFSSQNEFKRGPASASAALVVCNTVGAEQVCQQGNTSQQIVIRGRLVP
jgi:hypothetical protein